MIERERQTPERPTPAAIFQAMQLEKAGASMPDFILTLHDKYSGSRVMSQARAVRNGYRTMPWVGANPQEARIIRATFLDSFVLGYHVARKSIPESSVKRSGMADIFNGLLLSILGEISQDDKNAAEVNAIVMSSLQVFADEARALAPGYSKEFTSVEAEIVKTPAHIEFAQLGFGVAIGLGISAQDAIVDPGENV